MWQLCEAVIGSYIFFLSLRIVSSNLSLFSNHLWFCGVIVFVRNASWPVRAVTRMFPHFYSGKFSKKNIVEIIETMRKEYGSIVKLGGMMGKPDVVIVFEAEDLEKVRALWTFLDVALGGHLQYTCSVSQVLRNEGIWPVRKGSDSLEYYFQHVRKNHVISLIAA